MTPHFYGEASFGDGAWRLKLGTAAASRPYHGSMVGGTPTLLEGLLGGFASSCEDLYSFYQLPMSSEGSEVLLPLLQTSKEAGFFAPGIWY